jgi:hypothetical protein
MIIILTPKNGSKIFARQSCIGWYEMHFLEIVHFAISLRPQAYLDPGSGSIIIQLLIAGIVGAGFLIKKYWKKIKGLFNRSFSKRAEDDTDIQQ